jgi:hypothetical protein
MTAAVSERLSSHSQEGIFLERRRPEAYLWYSNLAKNTSYLALTADKVLQNCAKSHQLKGGQSWERRALRHASTPFQK